MKKKSRLLSLGLALAVAVALNVAPVTAATGVGDLASGSVVEDDTEKSYETVDEPIKTLDDEFTEVAEDTVAVAKIGSTGYDTLAAAFAAAVSGDTITLVSDTTVSELIEIKSSQNITLNLAAYTITGEMSNRMFAVSGTLTITADEGGTIKNIGSSNAISNGGTLIIESGAITATSAYAIYNTGILTVNGGTTTGGTSSTGYAVYIAGGTVTINGGTFTSTNTGVGAVRNNATLIINAGTVGDTTNDIYGVYNAGIVTVNGGTLSGSTAGLINTESGSSVTVYAGTLQGGKRGLYNSTGTATIYGGSFSGTEYGLMTNSPSENLSIVYTGTFYGGSRAIVGYLTSTIAEGSFFESGSYDQTNCVVAVGVALGVSTGSTTTVYGSLASDEGESTMYVKVSADKIGTYSTEAYPTTSLTFTDDSGETHNYIFAGWYSYSDGSYIAMTTFPTEEAYARFVDADALKVACVFTPASITGSGNAWRFVSSWASTDVNALLLVVNGTEHSVSTYYDYSTVGNFNFVPSDFSSVSEYVSSYGFVESDSAASSYTVCAGWLTKDGTKVYGTEYTFIKPDTTLQTILTSSEEEGDVYLGSSGDNAVKVLATVVSGSGTNTVYVRVASEYIGATGIYSTSAYPTTSLTYISENSKDSGEYIFAGWYTSSDEITFTACTENIWESASTGTNYYAKFVEANALQVACVFTPASITESGNAWRFVSSWASTDANALLFVVNGTESSVSIYYDYSTVGDYKFVPSDFSSVSAYVSSYGFLDSTSAPSYSYTVQAGWVTGDGTKVYGDTYIFTASEDIASQTVLSAVGAN